MDKYDTIEIYCRRLGHYLHFKYCRNVNDGLPCNKIRDCTFEKIPIQDYLNDSYTELEIRTALTPPQNKMTSLVDLIKKAKERNQSH